MSASHGVLIITQLLEALNLKHSVSIDGLDGSVTDINAPLFAAREENETDNNTTPKIKVNMREGEILSKGAKWPAEQKLKKKINNKKVLAGSDSPFRGKDNPSYHFFKEADWYLFYEQSLLNAAQFLLSTEQAQAEVESQLKRHPQNQQLFVFPPLPNILEESTVQIKQEQIQTKDVLDSFDRDENANPAVQFLLKSVDEGQKITLLSLGPLSNIARW